MKRKYYVFFILLFFSMINAQEMKILTLDGCHHNAEQQYPLIKKRDLITKSLEYSISNISKGYLPQLSGLNQLTWQSDVTKFPVSNRNADMPEISQTQYKGYAEVTQLVYDGGVIRQKKSNEEVNAKVMTQSLEVELYKLRDRINNLFLGIIMIDEQLKTNQLYKDDINIGLKSVEAQIKNGTSFRSNADLLKAELLKADQKSNALKSNRKACLNMLGLFIGKELDENTVLEKPQTPNPDKTIKRPELSLFDFKNERLDLNKKMINTKDMPKLSLFAQSGISNPGLNMFEEGVQNYFIGGARLTWSLSYTKKKEKAIIDLQKLENEADRETFLFNTNLELQQQSSEITKLQENLAIDDEIVMLRNNVKKAALAQLENGVITSSNYLREVNEENVAIQNKSIHVIELLLAQYKEKTTRGN
ncbi:TolC family protein [Flavobacterium amniphilum]|uniref:TolC family protein n=1 Tax=Flavobacterium amniphilum TaxID=1834035 RepID=UPI00202A31E3|nr:TolC family protein [Flavobacterium amniphilum]MCL9805888.1 TolC family protein [Flavobacterium amniphilum]